MKIALVAEESSTLTHAAGSERPPRKPAWPRWPKNWPGRATT